MIKSQCLFGYSYVFSTGATIDEVGKLTANNSISYVDGFIRFNISANIIELNYTADATAYNISMSTNSPSVFSDTLTCFHKNN